MCVCQTCVCVSVYLVCCLHLHEPHVQRSSPSFIRTTPTVASRLLHPPISFGLKTPLHPIVSHLSPTAGLLLFTTHNNPLQAAPRLTEQAAGARTPPRLWEISSADNTNPRRCNRSTLPLPTAVKEVGNAAFICSYRLGCLSE